jgi:7,8-dihydropterin-6-yl-methyl-4-(beta-D-ribofuranosyl)aminobenzene 5'-phosphate synthase
MVRRDERNLGITITYGDTRLAPAGEYEMTDISSSLRAVDSLTVDVLTDDVSDAYVSKTLFAVSEFSNIVRAGAKTISGETLLCANLGYGLRLVSRVGGVRHTLLCDTGTEGRHFHT